MVHIIYKNSVV